VRLNWKVNLPRLPRAVYWIFGATISCAGAVGARLVSENYPLQQRIWFWLVGALIVFFGLCIVSLGSRAHLEPVADEADEQPESPADGPGAETIPNGSISGTVTKEAAGAGEGNRTLA
jgi:hypothetical protein